MTNYDEIFKRIDAKVKSGSTGVDTSALMKAESTARGRIVSSPNVGDKYSEALGRIDSIVKGQKDVLKGGVLASLGKTGLKALEGVGYVLGTPVRAVASAGKEIADIYSGEIPSPKQFVAQTFDPTFYPSKIIPKSGNRWLDTAVGLGADIALDPLTYVSFGATAAAGRAGRIALAGKYARTAEAWGTKAAAQKLDDIVRYGEWALDDIEREFMELPKGLRYQWGEGGLIFDQGTTAGQVSGAVAQAVGKPLARARALIGDIPGLAKAQSFVRPRSYGGTLNKLGRGASLEGIDVLHEVSKYSAGVFGRAQQGLTRSMIFGDNIPAVQALDSSPYNESVYQVLDGSAQRAGRVVSPEEQQLADQLASMFDSGRNTVNQEVIEPFNAKRGVNAYEVGFVEDFGFSRSLTPEAQNYVRSRNFGRNRYDTQIGELVDLSPSELVTGTPVMRARKLGADSEWLGRTLKYGDVDEINQISQEVLGFKWFKTDAKSIVSDYVDNLSRQAGRVAFIDRLFDYGTDVVDQLIPKLVLDQELASEASKAIRALKNTQQVIANNIDASQAQVLKQAEDLAGRMGAEAYTRQYQLGVTQGNVAKLRRMVAETRRQLLRARTTAARKSGVIRQQFETVLQPLEARIQELERAVTQANADEETGLALLRSLHVRAFPDMDDASRPTTFAELSQQLTDEADRRFVETEARLLAQEAETGVSMARSIAGARGARTRAQRPIAEARLMAEEGAIGAQAARGELRVARGKFTKELNRLEKALANEPSVVKLRSVEQKYISTVNEFNQAKLLQAELQDWADNVLPVLDQKINDVRRLGQAAKGRLYSNVSSETFHKAITDAGEQVKTRKVIEDGQVRRIPQKVKQTLTIYSPEEYANMETFLSLDGKSGFAIKVDPADGKRDLVSVFNVSPRRGAFDELMVDAIVYGKAQKLDAFDQTGFLPSKYKKYGFREVERFPWDDQYAPTGWVKELHGTPDVVYMQLEGDITSYVEEIARTEGIGTGASTAGVSGARPTTAEGLPDRIPGSLRTRRETAGRGQYGKGKVTRQADDLNTAWSDTADQIFAGINDPAILDDAQRDAWTRVFKQLKAQEASLSDVETKVDFANFTLKRFEDNPQEFGVWVDNVREGWRAIKGLGVQMPAELENELFARIERMSAVENVREFVKIFDRYNRFFKVTAMLTPGFIIRNSMTAAFNNFVYGATLKDVGDGIAFARAVNAKGLRSALDALPAEVRAEYETAYRAVMASGGSQTWEIVTQPVASGKPSRIIESKPVKVWSDANQEAELGARMGMGLRAARRGYDLEQIASTIAFFHFDYTDMSKLDEIARVFVPFWTFASRNIPLQIIMQTSRPSMYRAYESFQRNMPVDEQTVLPLWLARRGPLGLTPGTVLNPDLPQLELEEQIAQFIDPIRLLSQLYPQYRLPIELAGNRQLALDVPFSEKPQPLRGPLDIPAGLIGALTGQGVETAGGPAVTSKLAYALPSAIPTLGTLQRLIPQLGGQERYGERQVSSIATALGLPIRQIPAGEQERELKRREFALKDYLDELQRRGFL